MKALTVASLLASACSITASAFPPSQNGGWTDVTNDIGLSITGRVVAVTDWGNDKQADLVMVHDDQSVLVVHKWDSGSHSFKPTNTFALGEGEEVLSAVTADINRDGNIDLAVLTKGGKLHIVYGPDRLVKDVLPNIPLDGTIPHLNTLNLFGRCGLPDLVALTAANELIVLRNTIADNKGCDRIGGDASFAVAFNTTVADPKLALKVGNVDFNGDCKGEFIVPDGAASNIVNTVMTIRETPTDGPSQTFSVPSFFGAASFGDYSGDGTIDIIFPACVKPTPSADNTTYACTHYDAVAVLFNQKSGAPCGDESCCAGHGSTFSSVSYTSKGGYSSSGSYTVIPFGCQKMNPFVDWAGVEDGTANDAVMIDSPTYPGLVRFIDYNRDTALDLLIGTTWGPMVLTNDGDHFTCNALDAQTGLGSVSYRNSVPFPFDLTEDGSVDVLLFSLSPNGTAGAYWNGYGVDENYFFTATMINGVTGDGYPFWGAVQPGAVHRFQWQDVDTVTRTATITQLPNSAAHTLAMPHAHFGLGRTFSPIQNYGTGVRNGMGEYYRDWSAYLMPNSQVIVLASPIDDPSEWSLRLFLYSLQYKRIILIALPTVLGMIGIPILVLKCREMKYDQAEKRQQMS